MHKHILRGTLFIATLVLSISLGASQIAHAAAPSRVLVAPSSVTTSQSQPDSNGGVWVHTTRSWGTAVPLSKPDAKGNVYATIASGVNPYSCTTCGGGCTSGYTTLDNSWSYIIGFIWFLEIDVYTQDHWDNCVGTVTNLYIDPQCVSHQGASCNSTSSGVNHDVYCNVFPTIGTCNIDWANINTRNGWNGEVRWQYFRTWVDIFGHYRFANNVG